MNSKSNQTDFPLGEVVGFHGLRGEIKVRPSTNNPSLLLDITSVKIVGTDATVCTAAVENIKLERRLLLLKLQGYPDRTSVEVFSGAKIFADKDELRDLDENEWWLSDLVGLQAYTTDGALIGTISGVVDAGNQLLEITGEEKDKTALIPFVKELVPVVDIQSRRLEIRAIPGLIEFS